MKRIYGCAVFLLAACSSVPETSYYLLTSSSPRAAVESDAEAGTVVLGLGRIEVADYLRQPSLVLETAEYQIRPATYHRWGEPLPRGVRRALAENLAAELPAVRIDGTPERGDQPDYQLDVQIERFHGTEQGVVLLGGRWTLRDTSAGHSIGSDRFAYEERITRSGYRASVEAQAALLARLSTAIAHRFTARP